MKMSSLRGKRADFLKCNNCDIIVCKEFSSHHEQQCLSFLNSDSRLSDVKETWEHPYIEQDIFYGNVDEIELSDEQRELSGSAILMHPATMNFCNIAVCGLVVVHGHETETLHTAWPCSAIKKMCVVFVRPEVARHNLRDPICVFSYFRHPLVVERLIFSRDSFNGDSFSGDELRSLVASQLCDTFISSNLHLEISSENTDYTLELKTIYTKSEGPGVKHESFYSSAFEHQESKELSFVKDFSNLTLNDRTSNASEKETSFYSSFESVTSLRNESLFEGSSFLNLYSLTICRESKNESSFKSPCQVMNYCYPELHRTPSGEVITKDYCYVTSSTMIEIGDHGKDRDEPVKNKVTFKDIGGLEKQKNIIKSYMDQFLNSENFIHGIIFIGPSGIGKTFLATAIANEYRVNFMKVTASEIFMLFTSGEKSKLRCTFRNAWEKTPCVVFVDELDQLCEMFPDNKDGVISMLTSLIDESQTEGRRILMLAAANDINLVHNSLRCSSRFDIELKFNLPEVAERKIILQALLQYKSHNFSEEQVTSLAESAHGYTGYDLQQLCLEMDLKVHSAGFTNDPCDGGDQVSVITYSDMKTLIKQLKPEVLRTDNYSISKVQWKDVAGMYEVKEKLTQVVELPLKHPEIFSRFNVTPSRGILLYGPPGCSKTMIAKALATESNLNFIPIKGPELFSKWVGESEKAVRDLFKKAKEAAPCIIFFDEIDALVGERGSSDGSDAGKRVVTQLLTEIDGAEQLKGVIIIAATNRPDILDPAMLRPGRLDHLIYVPLPDAKTRKELFQLKFHTIPVCESVDIEWLVSQTEDYSGAEVVATCHEAALLALSENWPPVVKNPVVTTDHFQTALQTVLPRIPKETIQFYDLFNTKSELPGNS